MIRLVDLAYWSCLCIYAPVTPNVFSKVLQVGDITVGVVYQNGCTAIVLPGSESLEDWLADLDALPHTVPQLDMVHWGLWQGMEAVFAAVKPLIVGDLYLTGHSKGAAQAANLAALCVINSVPVRFLAMFESPAPGGQQYADFMKRHITSYFSTRNGLDPVPDVPLAPFVTPLPQTDLHMAPAGLRKAVPTDWHLGPLIYAGVQRYVASEAAK
mgnify:CR=1 FL=1